MEKTFEQVRLETIRTQIKKIHILELDLMLLELEAKMGMMDGFPLEVAADE